MKIHRIVRAIIETEIGLSAEFTGLRMEFRATKTEPSTPNECSLVVYNLNQDSRNKINVKKSILQLYAGYVDDSGDELIFVGDITNVTTDIRRPDVITSIEASDGEGKLNETNISYSFKEGTSVFQVIDKVFKKFNLPVKTRNLLEPLKKLKFNNGNTYMGKAKKALDTLFAGAGMEWSIQNNEIKCYKSAESDKSFAIELTTTTGLVGSPQRIKIKKGTRDTSPVVDGWRITSLLIPKVEPGNTVILSSKEIPDRSEFKVISVEHVGNSDEGEFITTLEVIQL